MLRRLSLGLLLLFGTACHRTAPPNTAPRTNCRAPLPPLPVLVLDEPAPPGRVVVLVIDAGSGRPIGEVLLAIEGLQRSARSDTLGRAELSGIPPGRYRMVLRALGYHSRRDSVLLDTTQGRLRLVQLRMDVTCLEEIIYFP